jgi:hypothetical protein
MPDRDAVQQIIATFGQTIGIGDLGLDDDGYCCLVIDQGMVINIELDQAAQRLRLYSVIGRPDGARFPLLFEANYIGQATGGGSLGLQPGTGTAVLSREVPVAQLDVPAFSTVLERFVDLTEDWSKRLQAPEAELAADAYVPPPQGRIRA